MKTINLKKLRPSAKGGHSAFGGKKLIVFDLDGTLAPTKAQMDSEMAGLIKRLLMRYKVAVIGGGKLQLFQHQFLSRLKVPKALLKNLSLFPVTATTYLHYHNGWKRVYEHKLTKAQVKNILGAFHQVFKEIDYKKPKKTYGQIIENRGSQVTWSALGQDVVKVLGKKGIALKNKWRDKNTPLKLKIAGLLKKYLPDLEVHAAGHTSIDVTKKGIDKGYGLRQMQKYLRVPIRQMLFAGDAIFKGGNDYAVVKTGVDYMKVKDPKDTKKIIRHLLSLSS
ncbi:MAG: HAD-IIB family hydrolase [Patescibacteria group bacterium]